MDNKSIFIALLLFSSVIHLYITGGQKKYKWGEYEIIVPDDTRSSEGSSSDDGVSLDKIHRTWKLPKMSDRRPWPQCRHKVVWVPVTEHFYFRSEKSLGQLVREKYGSVSQMDSDTKKEVIKNFPRLLAGDDEGLLQSLCSNEPDLQHFVMQNIPSYASERMISLFKKFDVYDEALADASKKINLHSSLRRNFDKLLSQSRVRTRALQDLPYLSDHHEETKSLFVSINNFLTKKYLKGDIQDFNRWLREWGKKAPVGNVLLSNRRAYGVPPSYLPYRFDNPDVMKIVKPSYPRKYQENHGTVMHTAIKEELFQTFLNLDAVDKAEDKAVTQIRASVESILKHALDENEKGAVIEPHKLLLLARIMIMMARGLNRGDLIKIPLSFIDAAQLDPKCQSHLFDAHYLHLVPTYRALLQRLDKYEFYINRLVDHFNGPHNCCKPTYTFCNTVHLEVDSRKGKWISETRNEHDQFVSKRKHAAERAQRAQEEAEEQEKLNKEFDDKLSQSGLSLVDHRSYITNKTIEWENYKAQQLRELREGSWQQTLLNDAAKNLLAQHNCSLSPFQKIYVHDNEIVLANEFVTIVNTAADQDVDFTDLTQRHIQKIVIKLAETGAWSLSAENPDTPELLANLCRSFLDYAEVHNREMQLLPEGTKRVGEFVVGPYTPSQEYSEATAHAAYQLANVIDSIANITITDTVDYAKAGYERVCDQLNSLQEQLDQDALNRQIDSPDYSDPFDPSRAVMDYKVESEVEREILDFIKALAAGIGAAQLSQLADVDPSGVAIAIGGVAISTEVAIALGVIVAFSVGRHIAKKALAHFKDGDKKGRMTTPEATREAKKLGFRKTNYRTKNDEPIYVNKKGNRFISPDRDRHTGGVWKMAKTIKGLDSKATRMGTYDANLIRIGP